MGGGGRVEDGVAILRLSGPLMSVDLLGFVAATLTTLSFLPQVRKTWASGSARDLSLTTLAMFFVGVGLWLVYGAIRGDVPLTAANAVTLALVGSLLAMKLREMRRGQDLAK